MARRRAAIPCCSLLALVLCPLLLLLLPDPLGPGSQLGAAAAVAPPSLADSTKSNTNPWPTPSASRAGAAAAAAGSTAAAAASVSTVQKDNNRTNDTARLSQTNLPCMHTQAPPELGWPTMRCPSEGVVQLTEEYDQYKALHRTLVHAPLPGVNSSHVEWWFRRALPSRVVYRGREWDAYKLWHPVDHTLFERTSITDPRVGIPEPGGATTNATRVPSVPAVHIVEQFRGPANSSERAEGGNETAVRAYGSGLTDGNATFVTYPLDATLVLNDTQSNMHRLLFYMGSTVMQELYHTWEDSPQGLQLTSKFILGGRTLGAREFNEAVLSSAFPPERREAWVLHAVEEFGNMPHFLPEVFERHSGPLILPGRR